MFGGGFGDAVFGDTVFADLYALAVPARRAAGLIGGSGFPDNWIERMGLPATAGDLDEREIEELIAVGLL